MVIMTPLLTEEGKDPVPLQHEDGTINKKGYGQVFNMPFLTGQVLPSPGTLVMVNDWKDRQTFSFYIVLIEYVWSLKGEQSPLYLIFGRDLAKTPIPESVPSPEQRIVTLGGR